MTAVCCCCCIDANCLLIPEFSGGITLLNATSASLLLQLERVQPSRSCRSVSTPSVQYVVHYRQMNSLSSALPSVVCRPPDTSACLTKVSSCFCASARHTGMRRHYALTLSFRSSVRSSVRPSVTKLVN